MAYGNHPQSIRRGQSWTMSGILKNNGTAVDLTGASATLTVNTWPKGTTSLYTTSNVSLSTASGGGVQGGFAVTVPASSTSTWPANGPNMPIVNRLIYDLMITLSDGTVIAALSGQLIVEEIAG